jgi:hypothetical protein
MCIVLHLGTIVSEMILVSFYYNTRQPEVGTGHNERVSFSIFSVCCAGCRVTEQNGMAVVA